MGPLKPTSANQVDQEGQTGKGGKILQEEGKLNKTEKVNKYNSKTNTRSYYAG